MDDEKASAILQVLGSLAGERLEIETHLTLGKAFHEEAGRSNLDAAASRSDYVVREFVMP